MNLNQFENDDNFEAHYMYTAREIDEQLKSIGKKPKAIIAGIGTSGHIGGLAKYFKERYDTQIIGVVPAKGEKIPGIKRLETKQSGSSRWRLMRWSRLRRRKPLRVQLKSHAGTGFL